MEILVLWVIFIVLYALVQGLVKLSSGGAKTVLEQPQEVPPEHQEESRRVTSRRRDQSPSEAPPQPDPGARAGEEDPSPIQSEDLTLRAPYRRRSSRAGAAGLIRSGADLRKAVIMSEVLGRPKGLE